MTLRTIAILSPGDMGHGVGKALAERGYDVITCLAGRSQRTKDLAAAAGFRDTESLDDMVSQADLIMSILVPSEAMGVAESVADAMRATGLARPFADCNAVSPQTARRMESVINGAGGEIHRRRYHRRFPRQGRDSAHLYLRPGSRHHGRTGREGHRGQKLGA